MQEAPIVHGVISCSELHVENLYGGGTVGSGSTTLGGLSDVSTSQPSNGQVLTWNGTQSQWYAATATVGASALNNLTDVNISTPSDGQLLVYSSNTWTLGQPVQTGTKLFGNSGLAGELSVDDNYLYVYTGSSWGRVATTPLVDEIKPVLTFNRASTTVTHEKHHTYDFSADVTVTDNSGSATLIKQVMRNTDTALNSITPENVTSEQWWNTEGNYQITYSATDAANNVSDSLVVDVQVRDLIAPTIQINPYILGGTSLGTNTVALARQSGGTYTEFGATVYNDSENGGTSITVGQANVNGTVNMDVKGTYVITYSYGNVQTTRTVIVNDDTIPLLTLVGNQSITIAAHSSYSEPGVTGTDDAENITSSITKQVFASSDTAFATPLNYTDYGQTNYFTKTVGGYVFRYSYTDAAGNEGSITRNVTVTDQTGPTIIIVDANNAHNLVTNTASSSTIELEAGTQIDSGVGFTITDAVDGNPNISITTSPTFDRDSVGTYTRICTATDASGNSSTATLYIQVVATQIVYDGGYLPLTTVKIGNGTDTSPVTITAANVYFNGNNHGLHEIVQNTATANQIIIVGYQDPANTAGDNIGVLVEISTSGTDLLAKAIDAGRIDSWNNSSDWNNYNTPYYQYDSTNSNSGVSVKDVIFSVPVSVTISGYLTTTQYSHFIAVGTAADIGRVTIQSGVIQLHEYLPHLGYAGPRFAANPIHTINNNGTNVGEFIVFSDSPSALASVGSLYAFLVKIESDGTNLYARIDEAGRMIRAPQDFTNWNTYFYIDNSNPSQDQGGYSMVEGGLPDGTSGPYTAPSTSSTTAGLGILDVTFIVNTL